MIILNILIPIVISGFTAILVYRLCLKYTDQVFHNWTEYVKEGKWKENIIEYNEEPYEDVVAWWFYDPHAKQYLIRIRPKGMTHPSDYINIFATDTSAKADRIVSKLTALLKPKIEEIPDEEPQEDYEVIDIPTQMISYGAEQAVKKCAAGQWLKGKPKQNGIYLVKNGILLKDGAKIFPAYYEKYSIRELDGGEWFYYKKENKWHVEENAHITP